MSVLDPLVPRPIDRPTPVPLALPDDPAARAAALAALDEAKIFAAPDDPADRPAWRRTLETWREDARRRYAFDDAAYRRPGSRWSAGCRVVAQVWLWDELLYSFEEGRFTPDRLLADAERFGGFDGVVLWHAYPVIGIDDRNQWDFYRDVPGLDALVRAFHDRGVRVYVDYNPWDTGTRRGRDDITELAALVADLEVDGVFLDTLRKAEPDLVDRLERARPGLVLEGESKLAVERTVDHVASWAQFFADSPVPGVLRAHWYERRHMQHHVRRWHRDHGEELRSAWLNGVGVMAWEVVFGVWVGWTARDAATLRRMSAVDRAADDLLRAGTWTPLAPLAGSAEAAGVVASTWSLDGLTLVTLANPGMDDWNRPVLTAGATVPADGRLVDLLGGVADLSPDDAVTVPAGGVAAVLHVAEGTPAPGWLDALLAQVAGGGLAHARSRAFPHRPAVRLAPAVARAGSSSGTGGDGTDARPPAVVVPAGPYVLTVRYRARETGMYQGAPYVDEWKPLPPRLHDPRTLQRDGNLPAPVAVAAAPVTRAAFDAFVAATGYRPREPHRFLAGPAAAPDAPATCVDLDDARAYCTWRGGRLPSEDEWQLAALVEPEAGQPALTRGTTPVWEWTESEHSDGRTRFVMLKGGSRHRTEGSEWYVEGGVQPPEVSLKLLLPGLGLARSTSIGFRCAWDVPAGDGAEEVEP